MKKDAAQWHLYPNFSKEEFDCKQTGENEMSHSFMMKLQRLRDDFGKPMPISSGYRSKKHSAEVKKKTTGAHPMGRSCDVAVDRKEAFELVGLAFKHGFTGIGIQQKGNARFIHLDDMLATDGFPRPTIWSY